VPVKAVPTKKSPVAYVVFNRPQHVGETFAAIRKYRPSQLFIIADGPRATHPTDVERCSEVRRIVSDIDWPCSVFQNYSSNNLGTGRRVATGLDWVFSKVDQAIVLEDDCLASPEFFVFCEALLKRYLHCDKVWSINGNSYQTGCHRGDGSYFFTKYPDPWGWATWRRAWRHFKFDLPFLKDWQRSSDWLTSFPTRSERRFFRKAFRAAATRKVDTWDYQWIACVIHGGGLCAVPNGNLVRNIGFNDATRTKNVSWHYEFQPMGPLIHPPEVAANKEAERYVQETYLNVPPRPIRVLRRLKYWCGCIRPKT
jgi:hypothetical protein